MTSNERTLRLRQLNDLHNSLVHTAEEAFCPALRWAMDRLGCPDAAAAVKTVDVTDRMTNLKSYSLSDLMHMRRIGDESYYECEPVEAEFTRLENEIADLKDRLSMPPAAEPDDGLCWIKACQRPRGHDGDCDPYASRVAPAVTK